jgi:penicillin-binding protein 1A
MALGAMETTLLNVVSGYTALAGDGSPKKPNFIKEIKEGSIDITIENNPEDISYLFDEITRTQLRSMLNGVTTYGTARRAFSGYDGVVYGKTGTTNNARDVWFVGFNANVVIGVYIGFDDPKSLGKGVAGGNTAAPIVRSVFDSMPGKLKEKKYTMPEGIKKIRVNKETGLPDPDGIIELIRE